MSVDLAWQKALHTALESALSVPVYDSPPEGASYPYVTLDRTVSRGEENLASRRERHFAFFSAWSVYEGQKEVKEIIEDMRAALHNVRLALDTGRVAGQLVTDRDVQADSDGQTYIGSLTVEAIIDP